MFLLYSCILICLTLILSWQEKVFLEYLVMDNFQNFMFSFISGCNFPFSMHFSRWPWLRKPPVDFLSFSTSIDIQCTTKRALVKLWNINVTKVLHVKIFKFRLNVTSSFYSIRICCIVINRGSFDLLISYRPISKRKEYPPWLRLTTNQLRSTIKWRNEFVFCYFFNLWQQSCNPCFHISIDLN